MEQILYGEDVLNYSYKIDQGIGVCYQISEDTYDEYNEYTENGGLLGSLIYEKIIPIFLLLYLLSLFQNSLG